MAYVQKGDNPISRMKGIKLSQKDLNDPKSASSVSKPRSLGVEGQGGVDYENTQYDNVEGQGGIDYEAKDYKPKKKGVSRQASPLNDRTSRKIKKGNKTAQQIVDMQNKRSSYKKTYLGDPDDLEGEMVRTADKPASKREGRKIKKLKKTENQLGGNFSKASKNK